MSTRIEQATEALALELAAQLPGVEVVVTPAGESIPFGDDATTPTVVLQGPDIDTYMHNYRVDETDTGTTNPQGKKIYDLRQHRLETDLPFTLHVVTEFTSGTKGALQTCQKVLEILPAIQTITVDHGSGVVIDYAVESPDEFTATPVPGLSNIRHYEMDLTLEGLETRKDSADVQAIELSKFEVVSEKKEA